MAVSTSPALRSSRSRPRAPFRALPASCVWRVCALAAALPLLAACDPGPKPPPAPPMPSGTTWAGGWETTFGVLVLEQTADKVLGVYKYPNGGAITKGVLDGKLTGGRVDFAWHEEEGGTARGRGRFEMQPSGDAFTGRFGYGESAEDGLPWTGTRIK